MTDDTLEAMLRRLVQLKGSDLHLSAGAPPTVRIDGELQPLEDTRLTGDAIAALVEPVLQAWQREALERDREVDFALACPGVGRFRVNLFHQRGTVAGVFRLIPFTIPDFETLGLPAVVPLLARRPRGLILVTGATGSGKTTTLAAMTDYITRTTTQHILTIEDPIEFVIDHNMCVVNQREVGVDGDTHGFHQALRVALREDPDVVLIGEMRDLETVEAALRIAETGHLTLATLHTNTAASTIHRVVDMFPPHQQSQVRSQLALVLEGILCQMLLPRRGGGRCLAMEILVPTPAVRNLIREDKIHQIYSSMQTGQVRSGMQTFNQGLLNLVLAGKIGPEDALAYTSLPDEMQGMLQRGTAPRRPVVVHA